MPRTSDKSELILEFVSRFIQENGYAPSVREIGAGVGLPTATWSMEKFTLADYEALFASLKDGTVVVDRDYEAGLKNENFANVTLNII